MINNNDLFALIQFCIKAGIQVGKGTHFCEISTNLRDAIPSLNPSVVEMVRDAFYPIQRRAEGNYTVVGEESISDTVVIRKEGFPSEEAARAYISEKIQEGFDLFWYVE